MAIRKPIFVLPLDLGTFVAGSAQDSNPVYGLGRPLAAAVTWRTNGNSAIWARGDFGSAQAVDFCALLAANAQSGTTIRLRLGATQGDVDGTAPFDTGTLPFISPSITREDGLYHSHLEIGSVQTYRYWRIDIGGHTGDFEASTLVLGKQVVSSRYYSPEFERGVEDLGEMSVGRWGVPDETPGAILRTMSFTLGWMSEAEFEASFRPMLEKKGKRGAVYCCFDPDPTTYRQAKTYLGTMRKSQFARGVKKPGIYSMDFEFLSMF